MVASLLSFAAFMAGAFVLLCALLYWRQDSFIFMPRINDATLARRHAPNRVDIRSSAGVLEGWWVANPRATTELVILYFGGNAEDVLYTATTAPILNARSTLVVNYRGYGGSPGKPSQKALYEDALAIYDYTVQRGVAPEHIVVMGRSLGSAVATMLAAQRRVAGAVLVTPFDSMVAVGARHYWFMPVRLLLKHRFPSTQWAQQAAVPAIILAAERDVVIPPSHARALHDAWRGPKQFHLLEEVGHDDVELNPSYYELINQFLGSLSQEAAQTPGAGNAPHDSGENSSKNR